MFSKVVICDKFNFQNFVKFKFGNGKKWKFYLIRCLSEKKLFLRCGLSYFNYSDDPDRFFFGIRHISEAKFGEKRKMYVSYCCTSV